MNKEKTQQEPQKQQLNIGGVISRFCNFLYWFIHNEIATPILMIFLIVFVSVIAPFYLISNYFYRYYCRVNGL